MHKREATVDNLDDLIHFYENEGQEELRLNPAGVHSLEYLTAQKYLARYLPPGSRVLDSCAGTGAYAFWLAQQGHRVTAGDIVPYNADLMLVKQQQTPVLEHIYLGDATDLSAFADGQFDAVLCMGALYHMQDADSRRAAVRESVRVLRPGGLVFATTMNRYAVILNNLQPDMGNIDDVMRFVRDGTEGIYYASTPGEAEALMESGGFVKKTHVALDGPVCFLRHTAGILADEGFARWKEYHFAVCEDASLLGSSYHNLYIGRKPD